MEYVNIKMENVEILTDLIVINKERIIGYAKAIALLDSEKNQDLISLFEKNSHQAQQFKSQLVPLVHRERLFSSEEGDPALHKSYKSWLKTVDSHEPNARTAVLSAVMKGEMENAQIYRIALANLEVMDDSAMEMIRNQAQLQTIIYEDLKEIVKLEMEQ